jgi:hypothetical protein
MKLEQLKEKYGNTIGGYEFLSDVDAVVTQIITNTGAEIMRRVEEKRYKTGWTRNPNFYTQLKERLRGNIAMKGVGDFQLGQIALESEELKTEEIINTIKQHIKDVIEYMTNKPEKSVEEIVEEYIEKADYEHRVNQNDSGLSINYCDYLKSELETLIQAERQRCEEIKWNLGAFIEEADFARKVGERTGNAEAVLAVQDVVREIRQALTHPTPLSNDKE